MNSNDNSNVLWSIWVSAAAIAGVINLFRLFIKSDKIGHIKELEKIIEEKDKIIQDYETKITRYQKLIDNDNNKNGVA